MRFRSELNLIGEQLAQQHAMVTRLQNTDSNWEQLCAEKIAEQQLKIKQVTYSSLIAPYFNQDFQTEKMLAV